MKEIFKKIPEAFKSGFEKLKSAVKARYESRTLTWKSFLLKLAIFVLLAAMLFGICVLSVSASIVKYSEKNIKTTVSEEQKYDCIIVLGALVRGDTPSDMLSDRLKVAVDLYFDGVAPVLLMSGDAEKPDDYNEVKVMKKYAIDAGVPEEDIVCDPYGLSTYDSIKRAKEVYKYSKICIVTQEYHLSRALYIADKLDFSDSCGYSADLNTYRGQFFRDIREVLARFKDFFYVLAKKEVKYTETAF